MPANQSVEPEYAAARIVLLDALDALAPHRPAVVVVGAQAIYLRTGSAGLAIAPFTTHGLSELCTDRVARVATREAPDGFTQLFRAPRSPGVVTALPPREHAPPPP